MTFVGLPFATLLAVGSAVAALTVLFYVLKLRRRPVAVPFSPIWQRTLRDKEASQLFSQLKRILSLLLQLALVVLLLFALGDPRLSEKTVEGHHYVVLVDASASMKATDVTPSRIVQAKDKVLDLVEGLGGSDRMLVAKMDASLTPLSTMTESLAELHEAARAIEATDTRADLRRGLSFALDSLRGLSKPSIILVSDGALGDLAAATEGLPLGGIPVSYVPVGKAGNNVAITAFSARRYPLDKSRYEVMLEVTNTNDRPHDVELTLLGDGQVVDVTRLTVGANERLPRFYSDLGGASRRLEAKIRLVDGTTDELPADDHAFALMPERRRAKVLVVTPGNMYLEAALLLDEYLEVTSIPPNAYPPAGTFDVTIFDGVAPDTVERAGAALYLNPPEKGSPVAVGRDITDFGFDSWEKNSPLLRWMALENVQVGAGHVLKPGDGDRVVGSSEQGPVLISGRRGPQRFVALGFDPRQSDLVLRVAWPLFVLNSINSFVEEETGYVSSFRTGEVWRVPVPTGAEGALLEDPAGRRTELPVKEGRAVYFGDRAGFYRVTPKGTDQPLEFAANLSDLEESRIKPSTELSFEGKRASVVEGFSRGVRREIWLYLVLVAVLLSIVEWVTYHRRVTV